MFFIQQQQSVAFCYAREQESFKLFIGFFLCSILEMGMSSLCLLEIKVTKMEEKYLLSLANRYGSHLPVYNEK